MTRRLAFIMGGCFALMLLSIALMWAFGRRAEIEALAVVGAAGYAVALFVSTIKTTWDVVRRTWR